MCVIYETRYKCGDKDTHTVPCNDTQSPGHETRHRSDEYPDRCNRPNCRNPNAKAAEYESDGEKGKKPRL